MPKPPLLRPISMNASLRRRLAAVLAGAAAMLLGLLTATWIRQDACLDAGGRWLAATRACEWPAGAPAADPTVRAYAIGALAGLAAAALLWRAFTFAASRGGRRGA